MKPRTAFSGRWKGVGVGEEPRTGRAAPGQGPAPGEQGEKASLLDVGPVEPEGLRGDRHLERPAAAQVLGPVLSNRPSSSSVVC